MGIFWLLVLNFALFALDNYAGQSWVRVSRIVCRSDVCVIVNASFSYRRLRLSLSWNLQSHETNVSALIMF